MTQGPVETIEELEAYIKPPSGMGAMDYIMEAGRREREVLPKLFALCRDLQQQLAQRDEELSQVILEAGECEPLVSMRGDGSEPMINGVPVYLRGDPNLRDKLLQMFKACNDWHDAAHERMAEVQQQLASADQYAETQNRIIGEQALQLAAKWLPISSAPRDGTVVLVFNKKWGYTQQNVACWEDGAWCHNYVELSPKPTHWQPLPAPPKE